MLNKKIKISRQQYAQSKSLKHKAQQFPQTINHHGIQGSSMGIRAIIFSAPISEHLHISKCQFPVLNS